jgi:hypothetical protein
MAGDWRCCNLIAWCLCLEKQVETQLVARSLSTRSLEQDIVPLLAHKLAEKVPLLPKSGSRNDPTSKSFPGDQMAVK